MVWEHLEEVPGSARGEDRERGVAIRMTFQKRCAFKG